MITYFIKSGLCLGLLLLFYHFVLEKEKMHRFNRFYLLGILIFSFLAPLFIIYTEAKVVLEDINFSEVTASQIIENNSFTFIDYLLVIYLSISSILLVRLLKNGINIYLKVARYQKVKMGKAILVLVEDKILPHSFWNYIFINKKEFQEDKIEDELFTHELTHVTQKHTLDILVLEIVKVVLWFNPLLFLLKKAIQLNHEFLADDKVISSHHNISYYQHLLLSKAAWNNTYYLASNLNYSLTKKRLEMMKTSNSKGNILVKKLVILPLLVGLVFIFADRVEAQTKNKSITIVEVETTATKKQMTEYKKLLKEGLDKKMFRQDRIKKLQYLYSIMSKEQKKSVKNINTLIPPPPPPRKIKADKIKIIEKTKVSPKLPKVIKGEKTKKVSIDKEVEIIEVPEVEEIEIEVKIQVKKESDWNTFEEKIKNTNFKEKEEVIEIQEEIEVPLKKSSKSAITLNGLNTRSSSKTLKSSLKQFGSDVTYYLDGKKISTKKFNKLDNNKIHSIHVVKDVKGGGKVYIYSK